jgi:peptide/nickel transport system substrate-binding protein
MKRTFLILATLALAGILLLVGCGSTATTTTTTTSQPPAGTTTSAPSVTASATATIAPSQTAVASSIIGPIPPAGTPVDGGTLRYIQAAIGKVLGYPPEMSPGDSGTASRALESLVRWDEHGGLIGVLATSWEGDPTGMTITWHLRQGVTFTDGTPWNADACKWNFDYELTNGRITDGAHIDSVEVTDPYTVVLHLNDYNNMMFMNYGWGFFISPTAFETAGGTIPSGSDIEASKTFARMNPVGTGPYILDKYQADTMVSWKKNPNYWRPGMPHYDAIIETVIPDAMTAMATMEAGEADMWGGATVQNAQDLAAMGFNVNWGPGLAYIIAFSSADPNSVFHDQKVRAAVEYAINRPALAAALGFGMYEPMTQLAGKQFPAYIPGFDPRPYNVQAAKDLLTQAGYHNGFHTTLMCAQTGTDGAALIQADLAEVGITVDIDVADPARYGSSLFVTGFKDMAFCAYGINPDATDLFIHFGPSPMTFRTGDILKSQAYLDACDKAIHTYTAAGLIAADQAVVRQASDDAMVVPLYVPVGPIVFAKYVHTSYALIHGVEWNMYQDWMDPH